MKAIMLKRLQGRLMLGGMTIDAMLMLAKTSAEVILLKKMTTTTVRKGSKHIQKQQC